MAAFSVSEIATWAGGRVVNESALGDRLKTIRVEQPAPLKEARASDAAFFFAKEYQNELLQCQAGVLITAEPFVKPLEASGLPLWKTSAIISCPDPYLAMALLSSRFAEGRSSVAHLGAPSGETQVHPAAVVHASAELGPGVRIGPGCVVEERARIGAGSVLYPGCYVGPGVSIGERCVLFPGVTLYEWTQLGNRVRLHAGVVIGADGFGYAPRRDDQGQVLDHQKIHHLGRVIIGDDVEVGANTCIDRGTFGDTTIGAKAKLDNQVQIGHNVQIGEGTIVCGCAGFAGSSATGRFAYVGGLAGVANQVKVGDRASVAAMTLTTKDVPPGGTAIGNPQREPREHFRAQAALSRLIKEPRKRRTQGESK